MFRESKTLEWELFGVKNDYEKEEKVGKRALLYVTAAVLIRFGANHS